MESLICPQCGARGCRDAFDALLAFEFVTPGAFGPVHHLTVACHALQHPAGHAAAALDGWRHLLARSLDEGASPAELMLEMRERFEGSTRVREPGARPPAWWPTRWPMTAADVLPPDGAAPDAGGHVARVRAWAASVRAALDERG